MVEFEEIEMVCMVCGDVAVSIATSLSSYVDFVLSRNVQEKSQMIR